MVILGDFFRKNADLGGGKYGKQKEQKKNLNSVNEL
jgi:hypothetical protein